MTDAELNAAVATEVMGVTLAWSDPIHGDAIEIDPRPYATDIAVAFEVVERMGARLAASHYSDGWYVKLVTGTRLLDITDWQATQVATLPRAICEAALASASDGS